MYIISIHFYLSLKIILQISRKLVNNHTFIKIYLYFPKLSFSKLKSLIIDFNAKMVRMERCYIIRISYEPNNFYIYININAI